MAARHRRQGHRGAWPLMEPIARLEDGTPLWLTGQVRVPDIREVYWTPDGIRVRKDYSRHRAWPILTTTPTLPDPYLAGRIDEVLTFGWGESTNYACQRGKELLRQARKHLWGKSA